MSLSFTVFNSKGTITNGIGSPPQNTSCLHRLIALRKWVLNNKAVADTKSGKAVNNFPLCPYPLLSLQVLPSEPSALQGTQPTPSSVILPIGSASLSCLFKEIFLEQYTHIQTPITQSPSKYGDDGSVALWFPSNSVCGGSSTGELVAQHHCT